MIDIPLFDKDGKEIGKIPVDESLFGKKVKKRLLHNMVVMYEANKRQGNASTKDRGEVEGSTKKPWKQKHTGRARSGTIRSPIWRHGGVVFGPRPRDYTKHIPKTMRRQALNSALLGKLQDQEVRVIEGFDFTKPSTKRMAAIIRNMGLDRSALIGLHQHDNTLWLSTRNLPRVSMTIVKDLNAYEVLRNKHLCLTKEALDHLVTGRKSAAAAKASATR